MLNQLNEGGQAAQAAERTRMVKEADEVYPCPSVSIRGSNSFANNGRLPIGVMIPTLNARVYLPRWRPALQAVLDLAEEAVVVDSYSQDGTAEYLKAFLRHPRLRFLSHPRGLYESWNFGVSQLSAKYTYIATVADTIQTVGLPHLFSVAEALGCDVVVSRPEFYTFAGERDHRKRWPVHRLWERTRAMAAPGDGRAPMALDRPARLDPIVVFLLSALDAPEGILGSAAGNLYRTETLQRLPFPTECGQLGDAAWAIAHAFEFSLAVTPKVFSRFITDARVVRIEDGELEILVDRLFGLVAQTARKHAGPTSGQTPGTLEALLAELASEIRELRLRQKRYQAARESSWPWIFSVSAWRARHQRNCQRAWIRRRKQQLWDQFARRPVASSTHTSVEPVQVAKAA